MSGVLEPIGILVQHHFGGGVYAKAVHIPAGYVLVQHKHKFDHLSVLASGIVVLDADGFRSEVKGPCCLNIKAGIHHGVKAVTDAVWYCIHASNEDSPEAADSELVAHGTVADMQAVGESMV
jgi:quercetin dioxygenase-like cupin family protein